mgnify:CR=1 FL=1
MSEEENSVKRAQKKADAKKKKEQKAKEQNVGDPYAITKDPYEVPDEKKTKGESVVLRFKDYYNESTKEKECPPGYFWCPVDKKCKKDKDKKKISDNPFPWDRGGINEGRPDSTATNTDKHEDYWQSVTKPGQEMRTDFQLGSKESTGGPTYTTDFNDPRLRAFFREETYNSMKHELPRKYRKGVTFFQLPNKVKKYIDKAADRGLKELREYTTKTHPDAETSPEWQGWDTRMMPRGSEFHPIDPSDYGDADEEFNTSVTGSVQNAPPDFRSPDIVAKQKQAYERESAARKKKQEEEKKSLFQQLYDYITRKDK